MSDAKVFAAADRAARVEALVLATAEAVAILLKFDPTPSAPELAALIREMTAALEAAPRPPEARDGPFV